MFLKSPFNKIVRSEEAAIVGVLVGIIIGVILTFFVHIHIGASEYSSPAKLCDKMSNVKSVSYTFPGNIKRVECKDNRTFDDF